MTLEEILGNRQIWFELALGSQSHEQYHNDVELVYVFDGSLDVAIENEKYTLLQDDFLIINRNVLHQFNVSENTLLGCFYISYDFLNKLLTQSNMVFWCNTVIDKNSAYDDVRRIFKDLIKDYFQNSSIGKIHLISKYFEILYLATRHFLVSQIDTGNESARKNEDRILMIRKYVEQNYQSKLKLGELAENLFLSEAFLSKYIKRHFGMNFLEYANSVRLNHAMAELLYKKDSITRIALQNGFANVGTFNRVFKEKYGSTPKAFRYKAQKKNEDQEKGLEFEALKQRVDDYIQSNPTTHLVDSGQQEKHDIDCMKEGRNFEKVWGRMINVGTAPDLLKSNMQNHIKEICGRLRFKYIRIWDLYASEMYIDIHAKNHVYNFDKLDRVLDFVVSIGVYPYLELNIKPKILLQSVKKTLIYGESGLRFEGLDNLSRFIESLVMHLIDRYSIDQVENWFFEFWKAEYDIPDEEHYETINDIQQYVQLFGVVAAAIKRYLPRAKVGGGGLSIRYGRKSLIDTLTRWKTHPVQPDFLTFYSYPYVVGDQDSIKVNKISTDKNYLNNYILAAKEVMQETGYAGLPIHVSEWNSTVSNRNLLNDSCFKGSFMMDNLISTLDEVELIGYWFASDVYADYIDSNELLNGSSGLLSKDGISKPAFYALEFMNRLGDKVLEKGEHYIVTDTGYREIRIACHNYKFLNHRYFTKFEDELDLHKLDDLFIDLDPKTLEFNLHLENPGIYEIKVHSINKNYGSLQDEWIRMACPRNLILEDVNYLKRICVPRIAINTVEIKGKDLNFSTKLDPNEIQFIQIRNKFR